MEALLCCQKTTGERQHKLRVVLVCLMEKPWKSPPIVIFVETVSLLRKIGKLGIIAIFLENVEVPLITDVI